jgi:DNA replication protein DnaC
MPEATIQEAIQTTGAANRFLRLIESMPEESESDQQAQTPDNCARINAEAFLSLTRAGYPARHSKRATGKISLVFTQTAKDAMKIAEKSDSVILLIGNRGNGKTQTAVQIALNRIRNDRSPGTYLKTTDLFGAIKATWDKKNSETETEIINRVKRTKLLVLDEFHEAGTTEWEQRTVTNILDHRYDDMLPTIIVSNCTAKDVRSTLSPSVVDRANEGGGLIEFTNPSYRK